MYNQETNALTVGLIRGRHPLPVDEYIFDNAIEDVHDYKAIHDHILAFLQEKVGMRQAIGQGINQNDYTNINIYCNIYRGAKKLVVYVTGLTPVTAELIAACAYNGVFLTLMNYNTATGEYVAQEIF